jgi:hypothetical protein
MGVNNKSYQAILILIHIGKIKSLFYMKLKLMLFSFLKNGS